jgi:hypothetical protein
MSLPRFLDRVVDATAPTLGGLDRAAVRAKLETSSVALVGGARAATGASRDGFLFAASLLARLYPRISLIGPEELVQAGAVEILFVNPAADIVNNGAADATLAFDMRVDGAVSVSAHGWNIYIDTDVDIDDEAAAPAALAAAAIGVSELFRVVFAAELGARGRRGAQPGAFNLVTLGEPAFGLPGRLVKRQRTRSLSRQPSGR